MIQGEGGDGVNDFPRPSNLCRACPVLGVEGADPAER